MIKHMVLFRFKSDCSLGLRDRVLMTLSELPSRFPAMKRFGLGNNISERDNTFSHVMTMEFTGIDELRAYLNSDEHESFIRSSFRPATDARAIASYWTESNGNLEENPQ